MQEIYLSNVKLGRNLKISHPNRTFPGQSTRLHRKWKRNQVCMVRCAPETMFSWLLQSNQRSVYNHWWRTHCFRHGNPFHAYL